MRVHALVQRATREAVPEAYRARITRAAANALLEIWPGVETDPQLGQVLRANTATLAEHSGPHLWTPDAHTVLLRAGKSLGDAGLIIEARTYFTELRSVAEQQLGHAHPSTLTIRHGLARWQGEAGDHAAAAAEFQRVLDDRIRVLGPDHPKTLRTLNNLAYWLAASGNPAGAAAALDRLAHRQEGDDR